MSFEQRQIEYLSLFNENLLEPTKEELIKMGKDAPPDETPKAKAKVIEPKIKRDLISQSRNRFDCEPDVFKQIVWNLGVSSAGRYFNVSHTSIKKKMPQTKYYFTSSRIS